MLEEGGRSGRFASSVLKSVGENKYKIGLEIDSLEEWDVDADHKLLVTVGGSSTPNADKLNLVLKEAEPREGECISNVCPCSTDGVTFTWD